MPASQSAVPRAQPTLSTPALATAATSARGDVASTPTAAPSAVTDRAAAISWPAIALAVYAVGVLLLAVRLVADHLAARRLVRASERILDDEWTAAVVAAASALGVTTPVRLLRAPAQAMPMVVGLRRPAILLSNDADAWTAERRRSVILHEMAHVQRRDCFTQTLASLARAVYWPHPGVWWAARRLQVEREFACDDRVLALGTEANGYANDLLEIAYSLGARRAPALAVTMARQRTAGRPAAGGARCGAQPRDAWADRPRGGGPRRGRRHRPGRRDWNPHRGGFAPTRRQHRNLERGCEPARRTRDGATSQGRRTAAGPSRACALLVVRCGRAGLLDQRHVVRAALGEVRGGVTSRCASCIPPTGTPCRCRTRGPDAGADECGRHGEVPAAARRRHLHLRRDLPRRRRGRRVHLHGESGVRRGARASAGLRDPPPSSSSRWPRTTSRSRWSTTCAPRATRRRRRMTSCRRGITASADVTSATMGALGYKVGTIGALITMRDHGVSPDFVQGMLAEGLPKLSADDLVRARDHGVTPEYVRALRRLGYGSLTLDALVNARDHGVSTDYVTGMRDLGFKLTLDELIAARDHGVTTDYVKGISDLGSLATHAHARLRPRDAGPRLQGLAGRAGDGPRSRRDPGVRSRTEGPSATRNCRSRSSARCATTAPRPNASSAPTTKRGRSSRPRCSAR